ncbi:type 1 fimbrial protein [Salmonella enterica]|nr:type 1 fimbrial protein [Salmonella enterica]
MNNLKNIFVLYICFISTGFTSEPTVNINYSGKLVNEPCILSPDTQDIIVNFGTIIEKGLYINGRTPSQSIMLKLSNCDNDVSNLQVKFIGAESQYQPGHLSINGDDEGYAIGFQDEQGLQVDINTLSPPIQLKGGDNELVFSAYVSGNPEDIKNMTITKGEFTATSTFLLIYN